ncbi:MAG TPA: tRNA (adenosine(37)-N6)-dimethylallyltransferase MiaA [Azospirillaceae bacterium]|nr:tRNA (adenosine(37)-N6)-dimethylallyltransferase MiaA [Azospirillaceae bacterium]
MRTPGFDTPRPPSLSIDARPVLVVGGPTASGKSALALDLAEELGGVVVNADSMQLYGDLRILTARPSEADEARVPHRLYGVLSAQDRSTAITWRDRALAEIAAAHGAGRVPVLVGGTGLYLKALMDGLPAVPAVDEAVRAAVQARLAAEGVQALHAWLARWDPVTAARLAPGDTQRVARAVEVLEGTGRPLSAWLADAAPRPPSGLRFVVAVLNPPRDRLYATCDRRFLAMLDLGALDEVAALLAKGLAGDLPVMKVIGVRELGDHLQGRASLDDAVRRAQQATRNYAKRQATWFRHQLAGGAGRTLMCFPAPPPARDPAFRTLVAEVGGSRGG